MTVLISQTTKYIYSLFFLFSILANCLYAESLKDSDFKFSCDEFPDYEYEKQIELYENYINYASTMSNKEKYNQTNTLRSKDCTQNSKKISGIIDDLNNNQIKNFSKKLSNLDNNEESYQSICQKKKNLFNSNEFREYKKFLAKNKNDILNFESNCFNKNKNYKAVENLFVKLSVPDPNNSFCENVKAKYPEFILYTSGEVNKNPTISFESENFIKNIKKDDNVNPAIIGGLSKKLEDNYNYNWSNRNPGHALDASGGNDCYGDEDEDQNCLMINKKNLDYNYSSKLKKAEKIMNNMNLLSAISKTKAFHELSFACNPKEYAKNFPISMWSKFRNICDANKYHPWSPFGTTPYQCYPLYNSDLVERYQLPNRSKNFFDFDQLEEDALKGEATQEQ